MNRSIMPEGVEKWRHIDDKQKDGDKEKRRYKDDDHQRRCRDDKQRSHGQGGDVWSRLGDQRGEEWRRSRPSDQGIGNDDEQKQVCDHEVSDSQSKHHQDSINTIIDGMCEMFKSFPPESPTSTKCLDDKKQIRCGGRTGGDRMDAVARTKNVAKNEKQLAGGADKENNPWKKSARRKQETDQKRLEVRQRQIDIGKETEGYKRYLQEVKQHERTSHHPRTPDKFTVCSARSWRGVVQIWRRQLHQWDPPDEANILTSLSHSDESWDNEELENT